eukprot:scaffold97129_cov63-Phaeocystis_antarctica.AAC.1
MLTAAAAAAAAAAVTAATRGRGRRDRLNHDGGHHGGRVLEELDDLRVVILFGLVECSLAILTLEARVGPRPEQRLDAASVAAESRAVQRRHLGVVLAIQVGARGDEVVEAVELAEGSRIYEGRETTPVFCLKVHPLLHEAGEGGEVALRRRLEEIPLRLLFHSPAVLLARSSTRLCTSFGCVRQVPDQTALVQRPCGRHTDGGVITRTPLANARI